MKNLDRKRICDISSDRRIAVIRLKDCITQIKAKADGTLDIQHQRKK